MKIYTRTGDQGQTGLFGGGRVHKDHPRVEAYGTVDELNAHLGWAASVVSDAELKERLERLQGDLFVIGSILATPELDETRTKPKVPELPADQVAVMEGWIDDAMEEVEPLRHFILPGGTVGASALHVARTVCRRAERTVVVLSHEQPIDEGVVVYLNRLSDLLFAWARLENHRAGKADNRWMGLRD